MGEDPRIEDLQLRMQRDPGSIAFAQLAEEFRRSGRLREAVAVCKVGLAIHPNYMSARVTLGRALVELEELDEAQTELEKVLRSAPENLAAIRGLADIHHKRGALGDALTQYRTALNLARNDPDLEETVTDLSRQLAPGREKPQADEHAFDPTAYGPADDVLVAELTLFVDPPGMARPARCTLVDLGRLPWFVRRVVQATCPPH